MRDYKTVTGLVALLRKLAKTQSFEDLKGYDKLSEEKKEALRWVSAEICEVIGTFDGASHPSTLKNEFHIPDVMGPFCSCSKVLGTSKDDFGREYCINCGKHVEQNAP